MLLMLKIANFSGCIFKRRSATLLGNKCYYSTSTTSVITTPIFYVNAVPHIGHLHSLVVSDALTRWKRLKGIDSFLSTGTDEHGLKIQQAASKCYKSPQSFCDEISQSFLKLCKEANIEYSDFIRTTEPRHKEAVVHFWNELQKSGLIYKGKHEGWYSISDEAFYSESQIVKETNEQGESRMVSIESGQPVEWMTEENYKFRLSALKVPLLEWLERDPTVICPKPRYNQVISYLKDTELPDLSISRPKSRLNWGIPVPGDPDQVIYVWLDALVNYLTVMKYPSSQSSFLQPNYTHVIGKDILKFHSIYWPAFLIGANLKPPQKIIAHSHWTMDKRKMSKSRGNVVNPFEDLKKFGNEPVRYYLLRDGGLNDDGDYSHNAILGRYKNELMGQLGNLLSRSTSPTINKSRLFPSWEQCLFLESDQKLISMLENLPVDYDRFIEKSEFNQALEKLMLCVGEANRVFTINKPWELVKTCKSQNRIDAILFLVYETLRISGILLQPVLPISSSRLLSILNIPTDRRSFTHSFMNKEGRCLKSIENAGVLFPPLI